MREIKFRAWNKETNEMVYCDEPSMGSEGYYFSIHNDQICYACDNPEAAAWSTIDGDIVVMQYTGFKDKNDLTEVYEDDIIGKHGEIKGNIHQMDKEKTDLVIQGFGTKTWCKTYNEAIHRGCKDAE